MKTGWTVSELNEALLTIHAAIWGLILVLPGDTFARPNQIDFLTKYAPDFVWGYAILCITIPMLLFRGYKHRRLRKAGHASLWTFWLGITFLVVYRSVTSPVGLTPATFLIILPFFTIALLHGILYTGLEREG